MSFLFVGLRNRYIEVLPVNQGGFKETLNKVLQEKKSAPEEFVPPQKKPGPINVVETLALKALFLSKELKNVEDDLHLLLQKVSLYCNHDNFNLNLPLFYLC